MKEMIKWSGLIIASQVNSLNDKEKGKIIETHYITIVKHYLCLITHINKMMTINHDMI